MTTLASNFGTSATLPFQDWRNFKEAFTPELVARAIEETGGPLEHCVDPFGGSGTTSLTCQFLGIRSSTIEVNPFLADLITAKLTRYNVEGASVALGQVIAGSTREQGPMDPVFEGAPATFIEPGVDGRYIFSTAVARRLIAYRTAIACVPDPDLRRLFRIALAAIVVSVSNIIVSGKGRRYRGGWRNRSTDPAQVDELFKARALSMLYDVHRHSARRSPEARVKCGDARKLISSLEQFDLAIFSPPYANSFDYTDVYNVELWALGYLKNKHDNVNLRNATLHSHVQIARDVKTASYVDASLDAIVNQLIERREKLWNRNIPEMIRAYFTDLRSILQSLQQGLRPNGRVYVVVGDSRYAGINIPVADLLVNCSIASGFRLIYSEPFRSMRVSPQQGGRTELRETLIVLKKF